MIVVILNDEEEWKTAGFKAVVAVVAGVVVVVVKNDRARSWCWAVVWAMIGLLTRRESAEEE